MNGEFKAENEALLVQVDDEKTSNVEPKRNTKRSIITKIKSLCEEHGLALHESDTTLNRSSKTQLHKLLAQKTEALIEKKMRDSITQDKTVKGYPELRSEHPQPDFGQGGEHGAPSHGVRARRLYGQIRGATLPGRGGRNSEADRRRTPGNAGAHCEPVHTSGAGLRRMCLHVPEENPH